MTDPIWQTGPAHQTKVNGQILEVQCWGQPTSEKPTIVLLHEGLGCVAMWKDFPAALAKTTGCAVLAYSRRGYGGSAPTSLPRPLDYMTDEALGDLPEILALYDLHNVVLLGHSDGASIASVLAGMADKRVRGLIVLAPHYFTEQRSVDAISKARHAYDASDLKHRLKKYHPDTDNAFNGWCDAWLDPAFLEWNIEDYISTIRAPVLAIQGEQDEYATLAPLNALRHTLYAPYEQAVLKNCGHAPHLDHPAITTDLVSDFITRLIRIEAVNVTPQ